jgi:hypothetical protein
MKRRGYNIGRDQWAGLPNREEFVLTPGGYRHGSNVTQVGPRPGAKEALSAKPVIKKGAKGSRKRRPGDFEPLHFNKAIIPAPLTSTTNPHWVAYSDWENFTGGPVVSIRATWTVPQEPATDNGQTIFIFPGIQSTQRIVQPVLQWGSSAAGGGSFWAIASWYAGDASSQVKCSGLIPVNPGDQVTGVITLKGVTGNRCQYVCAFEGQEDTTALEVPPISELRSVCLTLESYNISALTDYPSDAKTIMGSVEIRGKSASMPVVWTTPAPTGAFGEHADVVSDPGGDVELFY